MPAAGSAAAAQGLYLRQTSYMGYATPCSDPICAYDSTFKLVAGISGAGGGESVSFMSIPESGLAPCKTDSNISCPWYLIVDGGRVNAALDNGTAAMPRFGFLFATNNATVLESSLAGLGRPSGVNAQESKMIYR